MSKGDSLTQRWLRQNVQTYPNSDLVYGHADAVLLRHPTIRPKTDVYTYDDGRTQLLLCLHGLLPISFRGASYNIPIAVWVPREYPRTPPLAYVVPTSDMLIRAAPDMDISGRCLIDYVRNWERKYEGCSLVALLDAMHDAFSRQPPVYAKPKDVTAQQQPPPSRPSSSAPDYTARPPPPLPVERHSSVPSTAHRTTSPVPPPGGPPPLPAKPGSAAPGASPPSRSTSVPVPHAHASFHAGPPVNLSTPAAGLAARPPPPLPAHLPQELTGGGHYAHSPAPPPTYSPHNRAPSADLPPFTHAQGWAPGPPSSAAHNLNQARSQPPYRAVAPTSPPPPAPPPLPPAIAPGIPGAAGSSVRAVSPPSAYTPTTGPGAGYTHAPYGSPSYVTREHTAGMAVGQHAYVSPPQGAQPPPPPFPPMFAPPSGAPPPPPAPPSVPPPDLLDAQDEGEGSPGPSAPSGAPVPPRPPNPELLRLHAQVHAKLAGELASLSQAMALDAERLRANQADLLAGAPALRDEMARLEAVRDVCRGVAARLESVVGAGERNVAELRRKGDPEVDELVCSTTIVHNQLINLVAEDNAIEDTIYHLHRALNAGRVDLERFLRTTRVLAEEQFMKRALIEKIQTGMQLGGTPWAVPSGH